MKEKRKRERYPIDISLTIESLYRQDNEKIEELNNEIEVINISRSGLGFISEHDLPLDYYFNAKIDVQKEKHFYTVVKIIRKEKMEEGYRYGCEFVGLADVLSIFVEEYGETIKE